MTVRTARKLLFDDDTRKSELLSTPVRELGLRLPDTLLGRCIDRTLEDVRAFGIALEPYFYLSDAYGCVQGTVNIGLGFWDADPLLRDVYADKIGRRRDEMDIANPISADLDAMRPSLLPNLIAAAGRNSDRGQADFGLFEVGPQFHGENPGEQQRAAAGLRVGRTGPRHWNVKPRPVDAFDAKADAIAVLAAHHEAARRDEHHCHTINGRDLLTENCHSGHFSWD